MAVAVLLVGESCFVEESLQTAKRGKQRGGPPPGEGLVWPLAQQRRSVHPESRTLHEFTLIRKYLHTYIRFRTLHSQAALACSAHSYYYYYLSLTQILAHIAAIIEQVSCPYNQCHPHTCLHPSRLRAELAKRGWSCCRCQCQDPGQRRLLCALTSTQAKPIQRHCHAHPNPFFIRPV